MKVTENNLANSLADLLTLDQLSCKVENIGGPDAPTPSHRHIPSLLALALSAAASLTTTTHLYISAYSH